MRDRTVPGGNVEHRRDLRVVEADEIAQRDRGAVLGRESRQRGVDVELVGDGVVDRGPASRGSGTMSTGDGRRARRRASSSAAFVATR